MLKLYGFSKVNAVARGHTRDLRVLWALEEMQLPFELAGMDHPAHDLNTEAYRRLSPFEQIPSIDDDSLPSRRPPPPLRVARRRVGPGVRWPESAGVALGLVGRPAGTSTRARSATGSSSYALLRQPRARHRPLLIAR